jgi:hypothetical protein
MNVDRVRPTSRWILSTAGLLLLVGGVSLGSLIGVSQAAVWPVAAQTAPSSDFPTAVRQIAAGVRPAVVQITNEQVQVGQLNQPSGSRSGPHDSDTDIDDEQLCRLRRFNVHEPFAGDSGCVAPFHVFMVDLDVTLDDVEVPAAARLEPVLHTAGRGIESCDVDTRVLAGCIRVDDPQPPLEALMRSVVGGLREARRVWLSRLKPELDELARRKRRRVPLFVLGAPAQPTLLYSTRGQHAAIALVVGVLERPGNNVRHTLEIVLKVHWPRRTRLERRVVEPA